MTLSYKRSVRVGELIQQVIPKLLRNIKELDLSKGLVTVVGVKVTDDLLNCKIYYSVFGENRYRINEILSKNKKLIRHKLALLLNLRRTPNIFFTYDNTNENATRIFNILKKIEEEN
ncbi:MAG: 30S ribosome-binding factor RbfA [Endomicrobium sp.]|jgi:ribosome-binding factor A|nr:30S ribosome-binding factor RbfA [Endomicrobium sp.]